MAKQIELVYPLYLDVPMMTSFVAALEDGVAYGSDITRIEQEQKDRGAEAEAGAGVPSVGILSSLFNFDLRGRITGNTSVGSNEEVKLIRKHTESSLFMRLRHTLKQQGFVENLDQLKDTKKIRDIVKRTSLVELTGDISRSPLSEVLEAFFRFLNIAGAEMVEGQENVHQPFANSQTLPEPEIGGETNFSMEEQEASQVVSESTPIPERSIVNPREGTASPVDISVLQLFNRIREDLTKSQVIDVVMRPSSAQNLNVVIALGLEFLSEGALDTLLSGRFTVLGKVTRVLKPEEEINLYQRTVFSFLDSGFLDDTFKSLENNPVFTLRKGSSSIKAPAIQVLPLAIYV